jgi:hypothetical protein
VAVVNVAEVFQILNMTILCHFHVAEATRHQIFSYFANHAIEVSRIVVLVKFMTDKLELIAVIKELSSSRREHLVSALGQQKKEEDVKTEQLIQMGVVIYINFHNTI